MRSHSDKGARQKNLVPHLDGADCILIMYSTILSKSHSVDSTLAFTLFLSAQGSGFLVTL